MGGPTQYIVTLPEEITFIKGEEHLADGATAPNTMAISGKNYTRKLTETFLGIA